MTVWTILEALHGLKEWKYFKFPVLWSDAPESTIQEDGNSCWGVEANEIIFVWATLLVPWVKDQRQDYSDRTISGVVRVGLWWKAADLHMDLLLLLHWLIFHVLASNPRGFLWIFQQVSSIAPQTSCFYFPSVGRGLWLSHRTKFIDSGEWMILPSQHRTINRRWKSQITQHNFPATFLVIYFWKHNPKSPWRSSWRLFSMTNNSDVLSLDE